MGSDKRLLPEDWAFAALEAIAAGGVDALSVERLAKSMDVTKGSFYWHFADRAALIVAAAEQWEQRATIDVIAELSLIANPSARLAAILQASLGDSDLGPTDAALAGRGDDELIGPIVQRVTATRLGFLTDIFAELGCAPLMAAERARITYSTYLGHFQVVNALTEIDDQPNASYLNHLVALLTTEVSARI